MEKTPNVIGTYRRYSLCTHTDIGGLKFERKNLVTLRSRAFGGRSIQGRTAEEHLPPFSIEKDIYDFNLAMESFVVRSGVYRL